MPINSITASIIGAAISVHKELGPGLLESAYRACLLQELANRHLHVESEKAMPVVYKGVQVNCGYRIDILVEHLVVVELKAIERLEPVHAAQVLTYLKLSGHQVGLLINFNVKFLRDGIRRLVLDLPESSPRLRLEPRPSRLNDGPIGQS